MTEKAMPNPSLFSNFSLDGRLINPCLELIDSYGETYVSNSSQIVYIAFLFNITMDEKKSHELDEQIEAENSDISCSSCPFDVMTQKILGIFRRK